MIPWVVFHACIFVVSVCFQDDAVLGAWSSFGECDNTCGDGAQTRTRECIINEEGCTPTDTSGGCEGDLSESRCCVGFSACGQYHKALFSWFSRFLRMFGLSFTVNLSTATKCSNDGVVHCLKCLWDTCSASAILNKKSFLS